MTTQSSIIAQTAQAALKATNALTNATTELNTQLNNTYRAASRSIDNKTTFASTLRDDYGISALNATVALRNVARTIDDTTATLATILGLLEIFVRDADHTTENN